MLQLVDISYIRNDVASKHARRQISLLIPHGGYLLKLAPIFPNPYICISMQEFMQY